jgi:chromosome segregation and condensation protein ScpB
MLYVTTEKFLRVFGIQSLSELPATETIVPPREETPMVAEEELVDEESGVTSSEEEDGVVQEEMDLSAVE